MVILAASLWGAGAAGFAARLRGGLATVAEVGGCSLSSMCANVHAATVVPLSDVFGDDMRVRHMVLNPLKVTGPLWSIIHIQA